MKLGDIHKQRTFIALLWLPCRCCFDYLNHVVNGMVFQKFRYVFHVWQANKLYATRVSVHRLRYPLCVFNSRLIVVLEYGYPLTHQVWREIILPPTSATRGCSNRNPRRWLANLFVVGLYDG